MTTAGLSRVRNAARFFGQSLLSLLFDIGGLVAGVLLATYLGVFSQVPWAILLFPGILSIRGAVGGLFSGRLSTALHIGTIKPTIIHNTPEYYDLIQSVALLTLTSAVSMGAMSSIFSMVLLHTSLLDMIVMVMIVITTMGLSLIVISPITVAISVVSVRKGLDPDVVTYPVVSTVADILVTLCYIAVLYGYIAAIAIPAMIAFSLSFIITGAVVIYRDRGDRSVLRTLRQFLSTLIIVTVIVNITGSFLDRISRIVSTRPELYMVYPALIDTVGDAGSIVGSTTTTEIAMGTLRPSMSSVARQKMEIVMAWLASIAMFCLYGIIASLTFGVDLFGFLRLISTLIISNMISVLAVALIAFTLAIVTVKKGLNPDNFVIPVESSIADTITTLALLIALFLV